MCCNDILHFQLKAVGGVVVTTQKYIYEEFLNSHLDLTVGELKTALTT
jgi:DNA-binding FrmR family transcriptional regulator